MNRFLIYLEEAGILRDQFDATDPEHIEAYLHWNSIQHRPGWDLREQKRQEDCHALAAGLVLECLEAGASNGPLPPLPQEFLERLQARLEEHEIVRATTRRGMLPAYVCAMEYAVAGLLGWPLEKPLHDNVDPRILEPWAALARGLVFQRVDDACTRCRKALVKPVIDFSAERQGLDWTVIAEQIVERLISRQRWLAWAKELVCGRDPDRLRGNTRNRYLTRMTQHSVRIWIPDELVNKRHPEGPTLGFFNHIDRAVLGFCTGYDQKYRKRFFGTQFKPSGLPTGMLFPALGLILGQVCVWRCSKCNQWKSDRCGKPECAFARVGPMALARGRLLLKRDAHFPGRFAEREVWRCNNPACAGHEFYFFAEKCKSKCARKTGHDCCPLCGQPHAIGGHPWFIPDDFTKPSQLARKLCEAGDQVSRDIWSQCASVEQKRLINLTAKGDDSNADEIRRVLVDLFNNLLEGPCFYDAARFAPLPEATAKLLQQHLKKALTQGRLLRLNRMLLEAAYPMEIANRSQGRAVRTITAYELRPGGPEERSETGGGDPAGVQRGEPAEPDLPDDADAQADAGEGESGGSSVSPLEAVEKAVEKALNDYQHYAQWVQEAIAALAHTEDGKFIWLKALLHGEEVDWAAMHAHIKDRLATQGIGWPMSPSAFEEEFKMSYREPLLATFDFQLDFLGYGLEDLARA